MKKPKVIIKVSSGAEYTLEEAKRLYQDLKPLFEEDNKKKYPWTPGPPTWPFPPMHPVYPPFYIDKTSNPPPAFPVITCKDTNFPTAR